jgi:hypothetical protein
MQQQTCQHLQQQAVERSHSELTAANCGARLSRRTLVQVEQHTRGGAGRVRSLRSLGSVLRHIHRVCQDMKHQRMTVMSRKKHRQRRAGAQISLLAAVLTMRIERNRR